MGSVVRTGALIAMAAAGVAFPQANPYVGSKACFACHSDIYRSFEKTGMGRSITPAETWSGASLPPEASISQPGTARAFRVFRDPSEWHQSESEPGVFAADYPLAYAVGSGTNGITFLIRRGNFLFQAPLSFYSKTSKWDLSPGYGQADLGFSRAVPEACISCHAGRTSPVAEQPGAFRDPPFAEPAIGCENCHGPGGEHAKSAGKRPRSIVNPGKLTPRLAENICMNCHQTGDTRVAQPGKRLQDFRPGEWLFDTVAIVKEPAAGAEEGDRDLLEHFSAMQASRCFRASGGKLSCLTCHDPHVEPGTTEAAGYFRTKCLSCHTEGSCTVPAKARAAQNPPDNCVGCHMPKRNVQQVEHSALTNHRIPAREGEPVAPVARPQADGLVIVDAPEGRTPELPKITLLQAYGELAAQHPQYGERYSAMLSDLGRQEPGDPLVQEALGHQCFIANQFEEAVTHLTAALPLHQPTVYLELAQAQAKLGRGEEAVQYLKTGVALAPYDPVMRKTLILQSINSRAYGEARQQLGEYVALFPEDSFMRSMLAKVSR